MPQSYLLLCALDASGSAASSSLIIIVILLLELLAHLFKRGTVDVVDLSGLRIVIGVGGAVLKDAVQGLNLTGLETGGELDVELYDQISELAGATAEGHTLALHYLLVSGLDHLTLLALHYQLAAVKVLNYKLEAAEGLDQRDGLLDVEVIVVTNELVVLHLLEH